MRVERMQRQIVRMSNKIARAKWRPESRYVGRLMVAMLQQISDYDKDFQTYIIDVNEICDNRKYDSRERELIMSAMKKAINTTAEFWEGDRYTVASMLAMCSFDTKSNKIYARFDASLKPYYLQLKEKYALVDVREYMKIESTYVQRLYDILCSWANMPEVIITAEELLDMLKAPQYMRKNSKYVVDRVLKPAEKLRPGGKHWYWERIRRGRAVAGYRFVFEYEGKSHKPQKKPQNTEKNKAFLEAYKCWQAAGGVCKAKKRSSEKCRLCTRYFSNAVDASN